MSPTPPGPRGRYGPRPIATRSPKKPSDQLPSIAAELGLPALPSLPEVSESDAEVVIRFTPPELVHTVNKTNGMNSMQRNSYQQSWRRAAYEAAREAADDLLPFRGHRLVINAVLPVLNRIRKDTGNYTWSAPVLKGAVDGLVDTQLLMRDDDMDWFEPGFVWVGILDGPPEVRLQVTFAGPRQLTPPF